MRIVSIIVSSVYKYVCVSSCIYRRTENNKTGKRWGADVAVRLERRFPRRKAK